MLQNRILEFLEDEPGKVAVLVENLDGNRLVEIEADRVFPSASTIKLAIMLTLFNEVQNGNLDPEDRVSLKDFPKTGGDGILKELSPEHQFSYRELCTLMIIVSDNLATNILIDTLGMERINQHITSLSLQETHLGRYMMDGEARKRGNDNFITAAEISIMLKHILYDKNIEQQYKDEMLDILKRQQVRGRLDRYLPEETVIANKTGDLDFLEQDAGIVYLDDGKSYLIIVLTAGMSSNEHGRETIACISKMAYDYFMNESN